MGIYIEWDDVVDRYPEISSLGGSDEVTPIYIDYAESFLNSLLSNHYTVPFSSNNLTAKDLAIDCVFWRAARFKLDNAVQVQSDWFMTIEMLKNGEATMITTSGESVARESNLGLYSSTQSYHSSFGIDDPINWRVDSDYMSDVQDSRD